MESKVLILGNVKHLASLLTNCGAACPKELFYFVIVKIKIREIHDFDSKNILYLSPSHLYFRPPPDKNFWMKL